MKGDKRTQIRKGVKGQLRVGIDVYGPKDYPQNKIEGQQQQHGHKLQQSQSSLSSGQHLLDVKPHNYDYQSHLYGFPCAGCIPETIPYIDYDHLNKWAAEQEKRKGRTWKPITKPNERRLT